MKRISIIISILFLFTLTALAEAPTLTRLPDNTLSALLTSVLGHQDDVKADLYAQAVVAGFAPEDFDPDAARVLEAWPIYVDGAVEELFTALSFDAEIPSGATVLGVVCTMEDGLTYTAAKTVLNSDGGVNVLFDMETVARIQRSGSGVFLLLCDPHFNLSSYYRDLTFAEGDLDHYYVCLQRNKNAFPTGKAAVHYTAKRYFERWDNLWRDHEEYIEKTELGLSSDGETACAMYTLRAAKEAYAPKIIIVSGQHGYEKSAPFGLYLFARDLAEKWRDDPILTYIHDHVTLLLLPCMNPYGFNNYVRVNANDVDLNRNYDAGGRDSSGSAPFSEPETRMVKQVVEENMDALCVIDFHNFGNYNIDTDHLGSINWHSYSKVAATDPYFKLMLQASETHIAEMTPQFKAEYDLPDWHAYGTPTTDLNAGGCTMRAWAGSVGVMGMTFEALNGFPYDSVGVASTTVQKADAELIGNWVKNIVKAYRVWG